MKKESPFRLKANVRRGDHTLSFQQENDLKKLFEPRGVAFIGASANPNRISGRPHLFFKKHGYRGNLYPVNPKRNEIAGLKSYASVLDVPDPVDLAIIMVDRSNVFTSISECGQRGVSFAIIFSAGFAETGGEGQKFQNEIVEIAGKSGLRIMGPNSMGMVNLGNGVCPTFSVSMDRPDVIKGSIALVAQSGAFGVGILGSLMDSGIGIRYFVSSGNEADLQFTDYLSYFIDDPKVSGIAGYLEGVRDFQKFMDVTEKAKKAQKPIILLKSGWSQKGGEAAFAHTSSITGNGYTYQSMFLERNILVARDVPDLLDLCALADMKPPLKSRRIGIVSMSGANVLLADEAQLAALQLPSLSEECLTKLKNLIPWYGSLKNPVDMTGNFINSTETLEEILIAISRDPAIDSIVFFISVMYPYESSVTESVLKAQSQTEKPIFMIWEAGSEGLIRRSRKKGIRAFEDPSRTIRTLGQYIRFKENLLL